MRMETCFVNHIFFYSNVILLDATLIAYLLYYIYYTVCLYCTTLNLKMTYFVNLIFFLQNLTRDTINSIPTTLYMILFVFIERCNAIKDDILRQS